MNSSMATHGMAAQRRGGIVLRAAGALALAGATFLGSGAQVASAASYAYLTGYPAEVICDNLAFAPTLTITRRAFMADLLKWSRCSDRFSPFAAAALLRRRALVQAEEQL